MFRINKAEVWLEPFIPYKMSPTASLFFYEMLMYKNIKGFDIRAQSIYQIADIISQYWPIQMYMFTDMHWY